MVNLWRLTVLIWLATITWALVAQSGDYAALHAKVYQLACRVPGTLCITTNDKGTP